jgi:hypothetical protein
MMETALAVTCTDDSLDLFVIGFDNQMYYKTRKVDRGLGILLGDWAPSQTDWIGLGGVFCSAPAVGQHLSFPRGASGEVILDAFGLGTDNQMYRLTRAGDKWDPDWQPVGGTFVRQPVAVSAFPRATGSDLAPRVDVFGLGTNNAMYQQTWMGEPSGSLPPNWELRDGRFSSSLAATRRLPNFIDVFGLGTDNHMYHKVFDGNTWLPGWSSLGGVFTSPPAAVSSGENRLDVFSLGTDNQMYHRTWDGTSWLPVGAWQPLGGAFNSAPVAVSVFKDIVDVFAVGTDNHMYHKMWSTNAWLPSPTGWQDLGGVFNSAPAVVARLGAIDVFGIHEDNSVRGCSLNGGGSLPQQPVWEDLGGGCNPSP